MYFGSMVVAEKLWVCKLYRVPGIVEKPGNLIACTTWDHSVSHMAWNCWELELLRSLVILLQLDISKIDHKKLVQSFKFYNILETI
jgi:hypothetical protein